MNGRIGRTGISWRRAALLLGPSLFGAVLAFGAGQDGPDAALASRIGKAEAIRIVTAAGELDIRKPTLTAAGIRSGSVPATLVPWTEVWLVQVRKRATKTGAWIGSGIFAALGGATAAAFAGFNGDEQVSFEEVAGGALVGGAFGAGAGALVGSLFTRWKTVYESPAQAPPVAGLAIAPGRRGGVSIAVTLAF